MPIIVVKTVKGVVLQSDEQKRELLQKMTDTFVSVVGEVARPYTYCLIEETPMFEWALAGKQLPDFNFLMGPDFKGMHERSDQIMRDYIAAQSGSPAAAAADDDRKAKAVSQWGGVTS